VPASKSTPTQSGAEPTPYEENVTVSADESGAALMEQGIPTSRLYLILSYLQLASAFKNISNPVSLRKYIKN